MFNHQQLGFSSCNFCDALLSPVTGQLAPEVPRAGKATSAGSTNALDIASGISFYDEVSRYSPSTEHFDRGGKWLRYQTWLPSLMDYVLVAQAQPLIEHYARQSDSSWCHRAAVGLDATIHLASINCTLALTDVYDRVRFEAEPEEEPAAASTDEWDNKLL